MSEENEHFSLAGRRISNQSPGELVPQQNPIEPVIRQGHWTHITDVELDKQEDVKVFQVRRVVRRFSAPGRFLDVGERSSSKSKTRNDSTGRYTVFESTHSTPDDGEATLDRTP